MNITNEQVTTYINGFYKPLNPQLAALRAEAEENHVPIILRETEAYILSLLRMIKPLRVLEIGTAIGYSAICFALANEKTTVTSLEVEEEMFHAARENIEKAGLSDRITVLHGDAIDSLEALAETMGDSSAEGYDLVFIDAAKGQYLKFWEGSIPLCKPGAVILSDNVLLKARTASDEYITLKQHKTPALRMRAYLQHITSLEDAETTILAIGDGVSVSILRG